MGTTRRAGVLSMLTVVALLLTGCATPSDDAGPRERSRESTALPTDRSDQVEAAPRTQPSAPRAAARPEPRARTVRVAAPFARAVRMLEGAPERSTGYDRDAFDHWTDVDADGCDTRDEVLIAEAVRRPRIGDDCDLLGGRWRSAYDGETTRDPSGFDVDHVVPLSEAWASGARRWSEARRESFANDQGDPRSLIAVTASSNRSKSDGDPADWLPDLARCRYARDWTAVKLRWDLAVDTRERAVLRRLARDCGGRVAVRVLRPGAAPDTDDGARSEARPGASTPLPGGRSAPPAGRGPAADPRFGTCGEANDAGLGDYMRGTDPEYGWYDDRDGDGRVCEA